ncbi:LacI family DNA-binding transcriptional regulator [Micromonospora sp. DH14]|uniref:LacI family DNA-binding transcriptional regulator n=1 Tax=Micromonospora sp. DH14 TaxID=3040120 RepID=UPI0024435415|nr:LacI family DNA-binding transcriptional regulator [Micromonospora sp. DH14]MDG9678756.1 LacI family DNA-binding transcriptional regulator [Micromonospora sp. DH14]
MRHRLKDVAERAGVAVKTVSNVVNGHVHVRPDTRARVEEAISELNYRSNLSARHLRKGRTGVIALAVPELDIPYFAELARYVVSAAAEHGWTVLIDQTGGRREQQRVLASGITGHLIDGLILSPLGLTAADLAGLRVPEDVAVAGFDDIEDGRFAIPALSTLAPDKEQIARLAVQLLADRLTGNPTLPTRQLKAPYRLHLRESTGVRRGGSVEEAG